MLSAEDEIVIEIGPGRNGSKEEVYVAFDGADAVSLDILLPEQPCHFNQASVPSNHNRTVHLIRHRRLDNLFILILPA